MDFYGRTQNNHLEEKFQFEKKQTNKQTKKKNSQHESKKSFLVSWLGNSVTRWQEHEIFFMTG